MERVKTLWGNLPKTVKVFFYLAVPLVLAEILIELRGMEDVLYVRISAGLIHLLIVALEETVPAVKDLISKK